MSRNNFWLLAGLVTLAVGVRLIIASQTYTVSSDAPLYIEAAQYYYQGDFSSGFSHPYHPLYPFLISLAYRVCGDWEWAGMLVSIILSSLAVIPLFLIGLKLLNHRLLALIAVMFYIINPHTTQLSSSILTTGTFTLQLITALYFFLQALENGRYLSFRLSGLFALLAYLTRPDGLLILGIFILWCVFYRFSEWWKGGLKKKVLSLVSLGLPWLLVAMPYILYLIAKKGEFTISNKLNLEDLLKFFNPLIKPEAFADVLIDLIQSLNPWLLLLIILGLLIPKRAAGITLNRQVAWLLWSFFLGYLVVLFDFANVYGRTSKRYTDPLVAVIIFWSALGLYLLIYHLVRGNSIAAPGQSPRFIKGLLAGVVITLIAFAYPAFQPVSKDKLWEKSAGTWIKEHYQGAVPPIVISDSNRIPYYAGGKIIRNYADTRLAAFGPTYQKLTTNLRRIKADYLVLEGGDSDGIIKDFTARVKPADLTLVYPTGKQNPNRTPAFFIYQVCFP